MAWVLAAACCGAAAVRPRFVGIDLGTTNSAVALLDGTEPRLVSLPDGASTTPSAVAFFPDRPPVVGAAAVRRAAADARNAVVGSKRFIGRTVAQTAEDAARAAFDVVEYEPRVDGDEDDEDSGGALCFRCPALAEPVSPEQVGALVLELLVRAADDEFARLDQPAEPAEAPVTAVVAVPAYFREAQRAATRRAAALAGLPNVALIDEPVAASLAYGLGGRTGTHLVFDLGAGTFDVSALRRDDEGKVEVGPSPQPSPPPPATVTIAAVAVRCLPRRGMHISAAQISMLCSSSTSSSLLATRRAVTSTPPPSTSSARASRRRSGGSRCSRTWR